MKKYCQREQKVVTTKVTNGPLIIVSLKLLRQGFKKGPHQGSAIGVIRLKNRWFGNGFPKRILEQCLMRLGKMWRIKIIKMIWKWIPKKNSRIMSNAASKDVEDKDNQVANNDHIASYEVDGVNGCLDQPIGNAKSHPIYIRKFYLQKPASPSKSSPNDEEEIDSSTNVLIAPKKLDMQSQSGSLKAKERR